MDVSIDKVLKRQKELLKELKEIDDFLRLYERLVGPVPNDTKRIENEEYVAGIAEPKKKVVRRRAGLPAQICRAAEAVLCDAKRPVQRGELVELIEKKLGFEIPSEDKAKYVGTVMWRRKDLFRNIEGKGYALKNVTFEDPEHLPGFVSEGW